jgi:hypothetical protein
MNNAVGLCKSRHDAHGIKLRKRILRRFDLAAICRAKNFHGHDAVELAAVEEACHNVNVRGDTTSATLNKAAEHAPEM